MNGEVADDLSDRLVGLFCDDEQGRRPVFGDCELFQSDPAWHDLLSFHEYFHGDNGKGLGAAHQTGWTALVASLILQRQTGANMVAVLENLGHASHELSDLFGTSEYLYIALCLWLGAYGAGPISLDAVIARRLEASERPLTVREGAPVH